MVHVCDYRSSMSRSKVTQEDQPEAPRSAYLGHMPQVPKSPRWKMRTNSCRIFSSHSSVTTVQCLSAHTHESTHVHTHKHFKKYLCLYSLFHVLWHLYRWNMTQITPLNLLLAYFGEVSEFIHILWATSVIIWNIQLFSVNFSYWCTILHFYSAGF